MIEPLCRECGTPFDVERADLLRGSVTMCPACRERRKLTGRPLRRHLEHARIVLVGRSPHLPALPANALPRRGLRAGAGRLAGAGLSDVWPLVEIRPAPRGVSGTETTAAAKSRGA
jgi:hypothetical protein